MLCGADMRAITAVSPTCPDGAGSPLPARRADDADTCLRDVARPGGEATWRRLVQPPLGAVPSGQHDRGERPVSGMDSVLNPPVLTAPNT